jgi:SAM-dependent methyltransferase
MDIYDMYMNEYTTTAYWDKEWENQKLQHFIEQRINSQVLKIISPGLFKGAKVLEIGCVPARRLYFLQKDFQTETYGLDYSLKGLLKSIKHRNHLVCSDLYHPPFKDESFDLVYSLGVIEHFDDPSKVISMHLDLVRKDGIILITVPNFYWLSMTSTAYRIARKYKEVKQTHNMKLMNINNFNKLFETFHINPLISDYYGPLVIPSPPIIFIRRICTRINNFIDRRAFESKFFSPDLVFIGKKI